MNLDIPHFTESSLSERHGTNFFCKLLKEQFDKNIEAEINLKIRATEEQTEPDIKPSVI